MPEIAAPAGWYFVRVWDGEGHVNGLARYPVAIWRTANGDDKAEATALVIKPQQPAPTALTEDDRLAAVGFCPPDREWQTFFPDAEVRRAMERWKTAQFKADPGYRATVTEGERPPVAEVQMPGVGAVPVRDARPAGQGTTADWIARAWGGGAQPKLPGTNS